MKLSDFKMLSFDTYGTLIDWESGIYNGLGPLLDKLPINLSRDEVLELFAEYEKQQQAEHPQQHYSARSAMERPPILAVQSSTGPSLAILPRACSICASTT
jgi:FMN phosphatase YigB (HAD superfamily)